jgi:hypothetical protein
MFASSTVIRCAVGEVDVDVGLAEQLLFALVELAERQLLEQPARDGLAAISPHQFTHGPFCAARETLRTSSISPRDITSRNFWPVSLWVATAYAPIASPRARSASAACA